MAKKKKFALIMKDDIEVRDVDGLLENYDEDTILQYYRDGSLVTWLRDRYEDELADEVEALDADEDDADLKEQLALVFGVKQDTERLEHLRQFTEDEELLAKVNQVAFDQEDLADLLDEGIDEIYLCPGTYTIPLRAKNKTYIGIGDHITATIRSKKVVDFDSLGIKFFGEIYYDEAYSSIVERASEHADMTAPTAPMEASEIPEVANEPTEDADSRRDYSHTTNVLLRVASEELNNVQIMTISPLFLAAKEELSDVKIRI